MMKRWAFAIICVLSLFSAPALAEVARFDVVKQAVHGKWKAVLYQNRAGGRLFCALETELSGTVFRINAYQANGDTFLEVFNPGWQLMQGEVRFSLRFEGGNNPLTMEMRGRSWGDSYTFDFLEVENYRAALGLISGNLGMSVINSNGQSMVDFSLAGADGAVASYLECTGA